MSPEHIYILTLLFVQPGRKEPGRHYSLERIGVKIDVNLIPEEADGCWGSPEAQAFWKGLLPGDYQECLQVVDVDTQGLCDLVLVTGNSEGLKSQLHKSDWVIP